MRATLLCLSMIFVACAPDDPRPAAQQSLTETSGDDRIQPLSEAAPAGLTAEGSTCIDNDGDGHGVGCPAGLDCDDQDPAARDECVRCMLPSETCPCTQDAAPVACDVDTNGPVTPVSCYIGQRTCVAGAWNRCAAYGPRFN